MTVVSGLFKSSSLGKKLNAVTQSFIIRHILWMSFLFFIYFLSSVQISLEYVTKGPKHDIT